MSKLYLAVLFVFSFLISFAAPKKVSPSNSTTVIKDDKAWYDKSVWKNGAIPSSGDTIYIAPDYNLVIEGNLDLKNASYIIEVDGTITLKNGKINIGKNSVIRLLTSKAYLISGKETPADKIEIGGVLKFDGKEKMIAGPAIASSISGKSPFGFEPFSLTTLPVKFVGFTAARAGKNVVLQWATSEEVNAAAYEIERSEDARNWKKIASVTAVGNSTVVNHYSYTDRTAPAKTAYYRIRQVDVDRRYTYTEVKTVQASAPAAAVNINTTSYKTVLVQFAEPVKTPVTIQLIAYNGQVVARQTVAQNTAQAILNNLSPLKGNYVVLVSNNRDLKITKQILL